jgi:hypothetical protein
MKEQWPMAKGQWPTKHQGPTTNWRPTTSVFIRVHLWFQQSQIANRKSLVERLLSGASSATPVLPMAA